MQTFLPYESFVESVRVLDDKRLGKQRSECKIILKTLLGVYAREGRKGWPHHPATKMWKGYEGYLTIYTRLVCLEWKRRGFKDTVYNWVVALDLQYPVLRELRPSGDHRPPWLGIEELHQSHRSNLLRKEPNHYRKYWPKLKDDIPYLWPVN